MHRVRKTLPAGSDTFVLTVGHRFVASELAFYLPARPPVYRWPPKSGEMETQYELWGLPCHNRGASALVVLLAPKDGKPPLPRRLREIFGSLRFLDRIEQELGVERRRIAEVWLGEEWRPPCSSSGDSS